MITTDVVDQRLRSQLDQLAAGRVLEPAGPVELEEQQIVVTPPFDAILKWLEESSSLAKLAEPAPLDKLRGGVTEDAIVGAWAEGMPQRRQYCDEFNAGLRHIARTMVEVRTDQQNRHRSLEVASELAKRLEEKLPMVTYGEPRINQWQVAQMDACEMFLTLRECERRGCASFVRSMQASMLAMESLGMVGIAEQSTKKSRAWQYWYPQMVVIQEALGTRPAEKLGEYEKVVSYSEDRANNAWWRVVEIWERRRSERQQERTYRRGKVTHVLHEAEVYRWDDNRVKKPPYIQEFLKVYTPWLRDKWIGIIAGKMLGEVIVEQDLEIERFWEKTSEEEQVMARREVREGRLVSPAVVLGKWVLAGWSDRQVQP